MTVRSMRVSPCGGDERVSAGSTGREGEAKETDLLVALHAEGLDDLYGDVACTYGLSDGAPLAVVLSGSRHS